MTSRWAAQAREINEAIQQLDNWLNQLRQGKPIIMPRRTGKTILQKRIKTTKETK